MPTNKSAITVITTTIALMAVSCVWMICFLAYKGIEVPPELNTLTGGLVGALTAMLVKTSPTETTKAEPPVPNGGTPTQVEVVNAATAPIPTEETKP